MSSEPKRIEILKRATAVTGGERQDSYGPVAVNFDNIARLWRAYLQVQHGVPTNITPEDVAWMMVLMKIARSTHGYHEDNFVDAAAYAAIAGECYSE